jgi:twitching motility protein PilT
MQTLLKYVVENAVSDLHLVAGSPVMVRKDGNLMVVEGGQILTGAMIEELVGSIVTGQQRQIVFENKDLDFAFSFGELARFRVNLYFQKGSIAVNMRYIPGRLRTIGELGLPDVCHKFSSLKQGFVLVTGPTGHGKSTTLAAILEEINATRPVHIVTIEDPIEYVYQSKKAIVSQREIKTDTRSWSNALKAVLREDPDVVLIGEMRDFEAIAAALSIAETGHLVFATLHTNSAAQTVDRIVDAFPQNQQSQVRLQLANNLEAVFAQRLVPIIGGGRGVAYELMVATGAIRSAIREGRSFTLENMMITGSEYGMTTLEANLAGLVKSNRITLDVAQQFAVRPDELIRQVRGGKKA